MKIEYSNLAQNDLSNIKKYISDDLKNEAAASRLIDKILIKIRTLKIHPQIGHVLDTNGKTSVVYRYLICDNYLVFYHLEDRIIVIARVLYKRRDILNILT